MFLLDFFFGYLGVGRFMMGLTATAVIKLIFTVLSAVSSGIVRGADSDSCRCLVLIFGILDLVLGLATFGWFVFFCIT